MRSAYEKQKPHAHKLMAVIFSTVGITWAIIHYLVKFVIVFQAFFGIITVTALLLMLRELKQCKNPKASKYTQLHGLSP